MDEILDLLRENNAMLKEILYYLRYMNSEEYKRQDHMDQFSINVTADIFVELMENDEDIKNKIKEVVMSMLGH